MNISKKFNVVGKVSLVCYSQLAQASLSARRNYDSKKLENEKSKDNGAPPLKRQKLTHPTEEQQKKTNRPEVDSQLLNLKTRLDTLKNKGILTQETIELFLKFASLKTNSVESPIKTALRRVKKLEEFLTNSQNLNVEGIEGINEAVCEKIAGDIKNIDSSTKKQSQQLQFLEAKKLESETKETIMLENKLEAEKNNIAPSSTPSLTNSLVVQKTTASKNFSKS